jgi:hypothetical protein
MNQMLNDEMKDIDPFKIIFLIYVIGGSIAIVLTVIGLLAWKYYGLIP